MDRDRVRAFCERLGIATPVLQAPMAGGPSTPELAAAVSSAGGLGSLAAGYLSAGGLRRELQATRALTARSFAVNVFVDDFDPGRPRLPDEASLERLRSFATTLGLEDWEPNEPPGPGRCNEHLEVIFSTPPRLATFTFGALESDMVARLQAGGTLVAGTATTLDEARVIQESGCDAVIAQGSEAGGHRGSWLDREDLGRPTRELVGELVAHVNLPVVAAGAVMNGADVREMLTLGASAVQMGTAFLVTHESGAAECWKQRVLAASADESLVTRAVSGRFARTLPNELVERLGEVASSEHNPNRNAWTASLRSEAARQGRAELTTLWSGAGAARARELSATALMDVLRSELGEIV